jgi:hypothetical protein
MICVQLDKTLKTRHMQCDHVSDWTKAYNVKDPLNMRRIASKHVTKHIIFNPRGKGHTRSAYHMGSTNEDSTKY